VSEAFWIKLYTDTFENPKIAKIRRLPAGNDILLIWIMLLATAGKCNAGGLVRIAEGIPYTVEDLADKFRFKESTVKLALRTFVEYGMIEIFDDGNIYIENWSEYQSEDKLAELRARDRERKRIKRAEAKALAAGRALIPEFVPENPDCVRGLSADTSEECPSIRIEKEKKEEKEERKEENFPHSCVHSANPDITSAVENYVESENAYIDSVIEDECLEGKEADALRTVLRENRQRKYLCDELGKGWVLMSNDQFDDLMTKLSPDELEKYFGIIVACERAGKHFKKKSHYQAILDMAMKDRRIK